MPVPKKACAPACGPEVAQPKGPVPPWAWPLTVMAWLELDACAACAPSASLGVRGRQAPAGPSGRDRQGEDWTWKPPEQTRGRHPRVRHDRSASAVRLTPNI